MTRSHRLSLSLSKQHMDYLKALVMRHGGTMAEAIRRLISEHMERGKKDKH